MKKNKQFVSYISYIYTSLHTQTVFCNKDEEITLGEWMKVTTKNHGNGIRWIKDKKQFSPLEYFVRFTVGTLERTFSSIEILR